MISRICYTMFFLSACFVASAQERQYVFTHFTVKEGLASNHVYSILQDKKGFIWLGTADGLQRYDGRKVISFRAAPWDTAFIPTESIIQLKLDKKNRFWVRTAREVGIFDPATFAYKRIPLDVSRQDLDRSEMSLWEDHEGTIFLSLTRAGVLVYKDNMRAFVKDTSVINSPANAYVASIQQDPDGNYWMASSVGLALFDRKSKKLYTRLNNPLRHPVLENEIINQPVTTLLIDNEWRMWIGNWKLPDNGEIFNIYDLKRNRISSAITVNAKRDKYHELHFFIKQNNGKVWAYGLNIFAELSESGNKLNEIYNEHPDHYGIRYDIVNCFYEDREHNIWLGTDQGVYVFNPNEQRFNSISLSQENLNERREERSYTSFLHLRNGDILSASWGQGTNVYDNNFRLKSTRYPGNIPEDANYFMTWSLLQHSENGKVWMGCQAGRLMVHDPVRKTTRFLNHPIFNIRTIRTMIEDKDGNIWLGTQHGRLIKWDAAKGANDLEAGFELVRTFSSNIYKIKQDDNGLLWIGSNVEGLTVMDVAGREVAQYNTKGGPGKSLYRNVVTDILFYNDSTVAICATVLSMLNKKTGEIKHITTEEGLPGNNANTMQKDRDGNLWIGLINGLCRYNIRKNIFTLFSTKDGIVRNEFSNGGSYALRDGRLIFSNPHDFVYFNPQQILSSATPPDVSITDFKIFNTYLPPDSITQLEKVVLPHNQNSITIEYAALSFLQKDKMVYYAKMEPIDKGWTRIDRYNVSNYTLLPPGDYTFKVRCENGDGIPSRHVTSLRIYIRPPFWQQEWFIMLGIFALAGIIYLAHRMRIRQLMQMEKVRGRI
ncbi:MAG: two-component regulator propeller domain-containing protein, partial [Chitinophagaceae bacterium]